MLKKLIISKSLAALLFFAFQVQATSLCRDFLLIEKAQPITAKALAERAQVEIDEVNRLAPMPKFEDLKEEMKIRWTGVQAPRALQELLGKFNVEGSPAPGAENPMAVNLLREGVSLPIHFNMDWKGKPTSTTVYSSLPAPITKKDEGYIVGKKYPIVYFHLHGGGTPTATGKNAMSIGQYMAKRGIPVLGVDLPGHGRGPRVPMLGKHEIPEWILEVINQTIHPDVKYVVISGHSYGGQLAVLMRNNSQNPKYNRISQFMGLNPPVDMSLGKNDDSKGKFDEWFQTNFHLFEDKIAPTDYEFLDNHIENGKDSSVAGLFISATQMEYLTPPMTIEEQKGMKPIFVLNTENDGLTFVGREKEHHAAFGNLPPDSLFKVLPPGFNFRTKKNKSKVPEPTGHNGFDRYRDGTELPETYTLMVERVVGDGNYDINVLEGREEDTVAEKTVDQVLRQWANFFQFRELVKSLTVYESQRTEAFEAFTKRKVELAKNLISIADIKKKALSAERANAEKALNELRAELGLENLSEERAEWELSRPEMTTTRKAELEVYLSHVQTVEKQMAETFKDPKSDSELAALWWEQGVALRELTIDKKNLGIEKLEDYKAYVQQFAQLKGKVTEEQAKARSLISTVHQKYRAIEQEKQGRYSEEREELLRKVTKPENVIDHKAARRELELKSSPERKQALREFLNQMGKVMQASNLATEAEMLRKPLAALPFLPHGIDSVSELEKSSEQMNLIAQMRFVPENQPEIGRIVERLNTIDKERESLANLETLEKTLAPLKLESTSLLGEWDELWKVPKSETSILVPPDGPKIHSVKLDANMAAFEKALEIYTENFYRKEKALGEYWEKLKKSGQFTAENALNFPPEVEQLITVYRKSRSEFMAIRAEREELRWQEVLAGRIMGEPHHVERAIKIARELKHESESLNLTDRISILERQLEKGYRKDSLLKQEQERLQYEYVRLMTKAGFEMPNRISATKVSELLNMSYQDLLSDLEKNPTHLSAMQKALGIWNELMREIRTESQHKSLDTY